MSRSRTLEISLTDGTIILSIWLNSVSNLYRAYLGYPQNGIDYLYLRRNNISFPLNLIERGFTRYYPNRVIFTLFITQIDCF